MYMRKVCWKQVFKRNFSLLVRFSTWISKSVSNEIPLRLPFLRTFIHSPEGSRVHWSADLLLPRGYPCVHPPRGPPLTAPLYLVRQLPLVCCRLAPHLPLACSTLAFTPRCIHWFFFFSSFSFSPLPFGGVSGPSREQRTICGDSSNCLPPHLPLAFLWG